MRWEGSAMLRRSPRRTLKAIITQAVALIVALAGSDLKRSVTKRAVAAFSRARWQRGRNQKASNCWAAADHRNESPEFARQ